MFALVNSARGLRAALLALVPAVLAAQQPPTPAAPPAPPSAYAFIAGGSFLGVGVREIDSSRAKALNLREEYGVEITKVEADSPAAKAGLKESDVVLEYQGQRVEGAAQFARLVRETPAGRAVKMNISRGGVNQTVTATIGARRAPKIAGAPLDEFRFREFERVMPDIPKATIAWRSGMLGIEGESLGESQLATFFGVKEGVLVRSVMKGSAAEKAGLQAGDVILKVDETKVAAPRDVTSAIRSLRASSKRTFPVTLVRERREMTLTVTLEDEPSGFVLPRGRVVVARPEL